MDTSWNNVNNLFTAFASVMSLHLVCFINNLKLLRESVKKLIFDAVILVTFQTNGTDTPKEMMSMAGS